MLIRFVSNEPSAFQALDEASDQDAIVEAVMLELSGRAVDAGRLSFWEQDDVTEDRLVAQHAARRERRDRVRLMRLPSDIVRASGLVATQAPDAAAFGCVARLHREIDLSNEPSRRILAEALVDAARRAHITPETHYRAVTKGDVGSLVRTEYGLCMSAGSSPEAECAGSWVAPLLGL